MYELDIGSVLPLTLVQDGRAVDLSGAQEVLMLLSDGSTLPLSVSDPIKGWVEYTSTGMLPPGFKRANVRVTFDAQHVYHFDTCEFRIKALFT